MAQDIVSGLFGLSPYQVEQQQRQATNQQAAQFAQMPAVQRGVMGLYQGGAGIANIGAGMLGLENQEVAQAKAREAALSGLDMSSPEAILQRASQIQDPRLKMQLQMLAQQKTAERQKMQADAVKMRLDEARTNRELALAEKAARGEPEMKYAPEILKLISIRDSLPEGDPRIPLINDAIRKANYIKPESATGMSAADLRQQKYEDAKNEKEQKKLDAAQATLESFEPVRKNILDLYDPVTDKLKPAAVPLFGAVDQYRGPLMLTQESTDALSSLTALKDQLTMSNLAEAKARVGQSFGSMQVQEWDKFVRLLSSLDRSIGERKAAENLKFVLNFIDKKSDVLNAALGGKKSNSAKWEATTPDEVKALFRAGTITREEAKAILKDMGV